MLEKHLSSSCTASSLLPENRRAESGGISAPCLSGPQRKDNVLKADQRISRCRLSVPSYPTPVLLEEVELLVAFCLAWHRNPSLLFYSKKQT